MNNKIENKLTNMPETMLITLWAKAEESKRPDALLRDEVGKDVEFKWSVLDTKEMETWNNKIRLAKEYYMSDYDKGRFPFIFRMLYHIPWFYRHFNQRVVKLQIG